MSEFKWRWVVFSVLIIVIPIGIFGIDIKLMADFSNTASISIDYFNQSIHFSIISGLAILIGFICIILTFAVGVHILGDEMLKSLYLLIILTVFSLINEGLIYKLLSCFNHYNFGLVQARSCLAILGASFLSFCVTCELIEIFKNNKDKQITRSLIVVFIILIVAMTPFIVLNSLLLKNLDTSFEKDISLKTIKMGLFTSNEIEQITNHKYEKQPYFDKKLLGLLDNIVNSKSKVLNYTYNYAFGSRKVYTMYYKKILTCDSDLKKIFSECENSSKLVFKLKYEIDYGYPSYSCAKIDLKGNCVKGCSKLLMNYSIYLIQEFDYVEPAWANFGRCEIKQPNFKLEINPYLNACI